MSGGLVPEVRVDRNGRDVRRWVCPDAAGAPAPHAEWAGTPQLDSDFAKKIDDLKGAFAHWCNDPTHDVPVIAERLRSYNAETIDLISDRLGGGATKVYYAEGASLIIQFGGDEQTVREYMVLGPVLADCEDLRGTVAYINGLHAYSAFGDEDLSRLDPGRRELAVAMLRTAFHLSCVDETAQVPGTEPVRITPDQNAIVEEGLVEAFLDHADRAGDIFEFIARATGNWQRTEDIRALARSTPRSLQDGFL